MNTAFYVFLMINNTGASLKQADGLARDWCQFEIKVLLEISYV
jgi:hypothetical protein